MSVYRALRVFAAGVVLSLVSLQTQAQTPLACDVTNNRVIDSTDIGLITAANGKSATGPSDARDVNGDGLITPVDAQLCTIRCTRAACSTVNLAPKSNAGPDQHVPVSNVVALDGAGSTDADVGNGFLTYLWSFVSKPAGSVASLTGASGVNPKFTADRSGLYRLNLRVTDPQGLTSNDTVDITTGNTAPLANAGADATGAVGGLVQLDGSASSDADGNALSFAWTLSSLPANSIAVLTNPNTVSPSFTIDVPGTYRAQLVVGDGQANSVADEVVITTSNSAPVANAGPDQRLTATRTVTMDASASSDAEGNPLAYLWNSNPIIKPAGSVAVLNNPNAAKPTFTADLVGTYVFQLLVNDGLVNSQIDTVEITSTNLAPVAAAGADQAAATNAQVQLDGAASFDPDGQALTYQWSFTQNPGGAGVSFSNTAIAKPTFMPTSAGTYITQLRVNDGFVDSFDTVTIEVQAGNVQPLANAGADRTMLVGSLVNLDGSASIDADNGPGALGFSWSLSKPPGSNATLVNPTTSTPSFTVDKLGDYQAQLIVNDGQLSSEPDTVNISTTNSKPVANAGPDQNNVSSNSLVNLDGSASSDADGHALSYAWSWVQNPGSAVLNGASTATPSFTPALPGTYTAQLIVSDAFESSMPADTVDIVVGAPTPTGQADNFNTLEDTPLNVAAPGVLGNDQSNGTGALTAELVGAPASGSLTLNPNGSFAYTPASNTSGAVNFTYRAQSSTTQSAITNVTINIDAVNDAPTLNAIADRAVDTSAGQQSIGLSGISAGPADENAQLIVLSATSSDPTVIPNPTFQYTSPNATGVLNFTPTANAGVAVITVTASDNGGVTNGGVNSVQRQFTVTTAQGQQILPAVTVTSTDTSATEAGTTSGNFVLTRTGGDLALPLTVRLNITGTASVGSDYSQIGTSVGAGNYDITILAGQTQRVVNVTPFRDNRVEAGETVVASLVSTLGTYGPGAQTSATVTIADDPAIVTVVASDSVATETGLTPGAFTLTRSGGNTVVSLPVRLNITGTASVGSDYTQIGTSAGAGNFDVTIPAGQTQIVVNVTPLADAAVETTETVIATLVTTQGTYSAGTPASATVNIEDDAQQEVVVVSLSATDISASEAGINTGALTLTRSGSTAQALTVRLSITGTAASGTDFTQIGTPVAGSNFDVTIPAAQSQLVVNVTPLPDNAVEGNETVIANLVALAGYDVGAQSSGTVTIGDDPAIVTVVASDATATEAGLTPGAFTLTRSGGNTTQALTVRLNITGTASVGGDYTQIGTSVGAGNYDVTILAGQTQRVVNVTPLQDAAVEGVETVIASLVSTLGTYSAGAQTSAQVNIEDDDAAQLSMSLALVSVTSANVGQSAQLRVTLAQPAAAGGVTVALVSGATGVLTVAAPGTVTIAEGQTQGTINVNGVAAGQATVTASATGFTNANLIITVNGLASMSVNGGGGNIGSGLIANNFTVTLGTAAPAGGLQVTLTSANATALRLSTNAATTGVGSLVVTVPAGATSLSYNIQGVEGITVSTPVLVSASAPGYSNASATMNIVRAGIRLLSVPSSATTQDSNSVFSVEVGTTNGSTFVTPQAIRPGGVVIPVTLSLINNAPADGAGNVVEIDPAGSNVNGSVVGSQSLLVNIAVGNSQGSAQLDPLEGGTVQVQAVSGTAAVANTTTATAATTTITTVSPSGGLTLNGPGGNIGSGLVSPAFTGTLTAPAPVGGAQVVLTSGTPSALLLSSTAASVGASSITLNVAAGATSFTYFIHGVEGVTTTTPVTITATAAGIGNTSAVMNIVRAGIRLQFVPAVTTTHNTNAISAIQVGSTSNNGAAFGSPQNIRPGGTALVVGLNMLSNAPADGAGNVAEFDPAGSNINGSAVGSQSTQVTIPVGASQAGVQVDMLEAGRVLVQATAAQTSVSNTATASVSMLVQAPRLAVNFANLNIGSGLINRSYLISLEAEAPAGGLQVTLTSSNPAVLRLSSASAPTGVGQLVLTVPAGENFLNYDIQGMEGVTVPTGVTVTASAPGFATGTAVMTVVRAGVRLTGMPTSIIKTASNKVMTVEVGTITSTGAFGFAQSVRPGGVPIDVTLALSNSSQPSVAELDAAGSLLNGSAVGAQSIVARIPVGSSTVAPQFDPMNAGTVQLTATPVSAAIGGLTPAATVTVTP